MVYFQLVTTVLLGASVLVQASPAVPRDNDSWFTGFLSALNNCGQTKMSGIYKDFAKTDQGPALIETLKSRKLSILAPDNSAFYDDYPSLGDDTYRILNFFNIIGNIGSSKRQEPAQSRSINPTTMPRRGAKRGVNDNQVQVADTLFNGGWKRWNDPTILIRGTIVNATVLSKCTYEDITILPINIVPTLPTKVDDVISKPLVQEAPYGFTKLGPALYDTGLMDSLIHAPKLTLFAPVDSGFKDLDGVSKDELKSILKNHVLSSILFSPKFSSKRTVTATSGKKLKLKVENGVTTVSCGKTKAYVLRSDVTTNNGVVHVIDKALKCD